MPMVELLGLPPGPEQTTAEESCKSCRFTKLMPNGRRVCRRGPPGPQPPDSDSGQYRFNRPERTTYNGNRR